MKRIAGVFLVALFVAGGASAQFTRISASDFAKDPAKVAALKRAVTRMKERNTLRPTTADFRQSWVYWANTHGYFGTGPNSSGPAAAFKADANSNCAGLTGIQFTTCVGYYTHVRDWSLPNDGISKNVWGTCQHGNLQFLPWHRMYLKYFERTMRKFSGDPKFALPYWDYYDDKGPGGGIALPTMMRGTATGNTLVDTFRTMGLNTNVASIDPNDGDASEAFDFKTFAPFSQSLEGQPHGVMHCGTGTNCQAPDIGIVPVAGLDPVFYMHHANIDRLWQCWMVRKANGATIDLAWAKANLGMPQSWFDQSWTFVDQNGAAVSMKVSQLFEPGGIDYVYDQTTNCVPAVETPQLEGVQRELPTVTNIAPVELRGRTLNMPLQPSTLEGPEPGLPEAVEVESGHSVLILENVQVQGGNPGITYRIYLRLRSDPSRREYVATINWFGVLHRAHAQHEAPDTPRGHRLLFYDVTDELARLGNPNPADVDVSFEPTGGTTEEAAGPSASAGTVTVGAIRIQTKR
ncbi:MAG TPA: tyrosinase family protein [Thermoanaerobaculia bacterium]|nr:tyrosinase family protein [Thermoanaerobaculia bacterium]